MTVALETFRLLTLKLFTPQQIKSKEGILRLIATKRHSRKLSLTSDRLIYVITIKSNINLLAVDLVGNIYSYNKICCFMVYKILFFSDAK